MSEPDLVPGLALAERIVTARIASAKAIGYSPIWVASLEEALIFIRAELYRQRNPDKAHGTFTAEPACPSPKEDET